MKKKYLLLCLIFSSVFFVSYSQKDYKAGFIVTNNFDTLRGYIVLKSNFQNSTSCEFFKDNREELQKYTPYDIRTIRIENYKYYISKDITIDSLKQRVFLEYLVDGIVDLFYLRDLGKEYYFVQKDTLLIPLSNEASLVTVRKNDSMDLRLNKKPNQ